MSGFGLSPTSALCVETQPMQRPASHYFHFVGDSEEENQQGDLKCCDVMRCAESEASDAP